MDGGFTAAASLSSPESCGLWEEWLLALKFIAIIPAADITCSFRRLARLLLADASHGPERG
jgi:hypothetical protein